MTGDQVKSAFQTADRFDLGIIAAGVVAFLFSFFPYYKASASIKGAGAIGGGFDTGGSGTWSAWHGFFGWFAALVCLVVAGLLVARLLGAGLDASLTRLAVLGGFGLATLCSLLTFVVNPLPGEEGKQTLSGITVEFSKGHAWGFWLSLLVILAGLALAFMRKDAKD